MLLLSFEIYRRATHDDNIPLCIWQFLNRKAHLILFMTFRTNAYPNVASSFRGIYPALAPMTGGPHWRNFGQGDKAGENEQDPNPYVASSCPRQAWCVSLLSWCAFLQKLRTDVFHVSTRSKSADPMSTWIRQPVSFSLHFSLSATACLEATSAQPRNSCAFSSASYKEEDALHTLLKS